MAKTTKKKSDKIAVKKIEIEVGGKILGLTPEEMKELRDILDATFPKETVYVPGSPIIIKEPVYRSWPYRRWSDPVWIGGPKLISTGSTAEDMHTGTLRLSCKC